MVKERLAQSLLLKRRLASMDAYGYNLSQVTLS
jgi:hypothetical protein